jgi:hypothetical protein
MKPKKPKKAKLHTKQHMKISQFNFFLLSLSLFHGLFLISLLAFFLHLTTHSTLSTSRIKFVEDEEKNFLKKIILVFFK